jgi:hypothetical protein
MAVVIDIRSPKSSSPITLPLAYPRFESFDPNWKAHRYSSVVIPDHTRLGQQILVASVSTHNLSQTKVSA